MPVDAGRIANERSPSETTIVEVEGDIDMATAARFSHRLDDAIDHGTGHVVIDLTATSFIDSTGLNAILKALARLRGIGGTMAIVCTDKGIRRLLEIAGLSSLIGVFATIDDAAAKANVTD